MTYPRHTVRVGRLFPGIQDDTPWYVGLYTERSSTDGGWSPLLHFASQGEALDAAAPLTGVLLPDWQPFPRHIPDTDSLQHPCPYDLDEARALLASHSVGTTETALPDQSGPKTAPERSCDDLEASL